MSAMVLALPENDTLARRLSELSGIPYGAVDARRFPDDETYLRIDADCAEKSIVIVCTLDRPDPKLLPLVFLADAARALGAARVGLVAPYLAYMRQAALPAYTPLCVVGAQCHLAGSRCVDLLLSRGCLQANGGATHFW